MRAVIQRVSEASVTVDGKITGAIGRGFLVLLGIEESDQADDVAWLAGKIARMRIFNDEAGRMNRDLMDIGGGVLLVSQFTLFASTRKGNRPSFVRAAKPETAIPLYEAMKESLARELGQEIQTGIFGADMQVKLTNDGPVTILIDSRDRE